MVTKLSDDLAQRGSDHPINGLTTDTAEQGAR